VVVHDLDVVTLPTTLSSVLRRRSGMSGYCRCDSPSPGKSPDCRDVM
jgi:hypothetical protein